MYRAPVRETRFVLEELLGSASLAASPLLREYSDELAQSVLEEAARFAEGVLDPLNHPGDITGARWTADGVVTAPGFREAYQQFVAGGWPALGSAAGVWRPARAARARECGRGVLGLCQPRLQARSDADARRGARARAVRLAGTEAPVPAEDGERRVDRHHGAHRAAGGFGSGPGAHARDPGWRSLPPVWPEDIHHLGRPRPHRQHHSHGDRAHRRRAARASRVSRFSSCRRCS